MPAEAPQPPPPASTTSERLFIALIVPAPVRDALAGLPQPLAGVSWSRPEQWHVTLRFLGDVPPEQTAAIVQRLASIRVAPFILPVEGVGTFPPGRPARVLWVGTANGHPRLFQLRQRIDDAVLATGLDLDVRSFHPHITLGRCTETAAAAAAHWAHVHREFTAPPFRVDAFGLYASELKPSGAVHTLKRRFSLES